MSTNKLLCFTGGSCEAIRGVDHGFVKNATSVLTGGRVTYKCFQGFTIGGNAEVTCLDSRKWGSLPTCSGEYSVKMYNVQVVHF